MNPEHRQQIYGGEISDYISPKHTQRHFEDPVQTDQNLANIYDTQIKGKPSVDTTGIVSANVNFPLQRDPHFDALDLQLRDTLNAISKQIGLTQNDGDKVAVTPSLKNQTQTDIEVANNNVLQALKELKDLKAI